MIDFVDLSTYSLSELKSKYLSNGYRCVTYQTDPISKDGYMYCMMFDKLNEPFNFMYRYSCRLGYVVHTKSDAVDIYGRHIKYISFKSSYERSRWIKANIDMVTIVDCIAPEQDFLTRLFWSNTEEDDFNKQPLTIHFIDIETEITESFEYPSTARNRVNLITVYNSVTDKFHTWSLQKVNTSAINNDGRHFVYDHFNDNEIDMLQSYVEWHSNNYPDVITGWNTRGYDIPYLIRRLENTLGSRYAQMLSPLDSYYIKTLGEPENPNNPDSVRIEVTLHGIAQLDGLLLYRDKFYVKQSLSGGYNLSNVGKAENLGEKIEYDGSLRDLYMHDWNKFYQYNVQDVQLTVDIENKLKLIPLARQIVGYGLNGNYERCYGSISYIIGSLYIFAKKHCDGVIFPTYAAQLDDGVNTSYEGAYVFETMPGIYVDGVAGIDVGSLYPNSIRAANISPDTYVGKIISTHDIDIYNLPKTITIQKRNNSVSTISSDKFKQLLQTQCILTKNNTLFLKPSVKWGVVPRWCEYYFKIRNEAKHNTVIEANKGNQFLADLLQAKNIGLKLLLNSVYGIMGSKYCSVFNPDIAQSITRQGRFFNISAEKYIRQYLTENYNISEDYVVAVGGDTDSCEKSTIICITGDISIPTK